MIFSKNYVVHLLKGNGALPYPTALKKLMTPD